MSNKNDFPIVLFTYKRLKNLKISINAIKNFNGFYDKKLIIFSDGPRTDKEFKKILEVRKFIKKIKGFKDVDYRFAEFNKGLANVAVTIINGLFNSKLSPPTLNGLVGSVSLIPIFPPDATKASVESFLNIILPIFALRTNSSGVCS